MESSGGVLVNDKQTAAGGRALIPGAWWLRSTLERALRSIGIEWVRLSRRHKKMVSDRDRGIYTTSRVVPEITRPREAAVWFVKQVRYKHFRVLVR